MAILGLIKITSMPLTTGIVKLSRLANGKPTGSYQQEFFVNFAFVEQSVLQQAGLRNVLHVTHKGAEQKGRVRRTAAGFGVKLGTEPRLVRMNDPFVGQIVGVQEQLLALGGKRRRIHSVPVILRRNVAPSRAQIDAGLIHPAITVLHLEGFGAGCFGAGCQGQQLISYANAKDGFGRYIYFSYSCFYLLVPPNSGDFIKFAKMPWHRFVAWVTHTSCQTLSQHYCTFGISD